MNNPIVRKIVAVVAGAIVAGLVVGLVEMMGHLIFPPPAGLDISKPEDQARLMEVIPMGAKIAVVLAWFIGSFAGAAVAMLISKHAFPGGVVAGLMVAASVATTQMFPHPVWMMVAAVLLPLLAAFLAKGLLKDRLNPS